MGEWITGRVVDTPNGNRVLLSDEDLMACVEENCGHEVSNILWEIIAEVDVDAVYAEERAKTDADSYESDCEAYRTAIQDASNFLEQLMRNMDDHKAMRKSAIYSELARLNRKLIAEL